MKLSQSVSPSTRLQTIRCGGPRGDGRGRIVLVISTLTHGGAEVQVKALAEHLAARGWSVDVICLHPPEAFVDELRAAGVPVHSLRLRTATAGITSFARLVILLRRLSPDVVHSHMRGANILTRLARPFSHVRFLVCTAHNLKEGADRRGNTAKTDLLYRLTDPLCDLTTNVSRSAVARYVATRATPADRIRYVPNGIDIGRFQRSAESRQRLREEFRLGNRPTVLSIGRFHEQKNHELLLQAFAQALETIPDARLLLAGAGELEPQVKALARNLGIAHATLFLGIRTDVPALLSAADCFAMSSRYEGLPVVLLEAAACSLPILATDVGGNPEIVEHGVTGLLVPSGDSNAFAQGLIRLLTMPPAERDAWGAAGRRFVTDTYAMDVVVDTWESIYTEPCTKLAGSGNSSLENAHG